MRSFLTSQSWFIENHFEKVDVFIFAVVLILGDTVVVGARDVAKPKSVKVDEVLQKLSEGWNYILLGYGQRSGVKFDPNL